MQTIYGLPSLDNVAVDTLREIRDLCEYWWRYAKRRGRPTSEYMYGWETFADLIVTFY